MRIKRKFSLFGRSRKRAASAAEQDSHRCGVCLGKGSREALAFIEKHSGARIAPLPGRCTACGRVGGVYDLPHLLALHRRGLMKVRPNGKEKGITPRLVGRRAGDKELAPYFEATEGSVIEDLIKDPMQYFLHPSHTDEGAKQRMMRMLGEGDAFNRVDKERPARLRRGSGGGVTQTVRELGLAGDPTAMAALTGVTEDGVLPEMSPEEFRARLEKAVDQLASDDNVAPAQRSDMAFTRSDMIEAFRKHGANCGPGALAAITGKTPEEVLPHLPRFDEYKFVTEVMMAIALHGMDRRFEWAEHDDQATPDAWPDFGLVRIAFEGPWSFESDRMELLRRSHWVATWVRPDGEREVYDINARDGDGWQSLYDWANGTVPEIVKAVVPGSNGNWRSIESFDLHPAHLM